MMAFVMSSLVVVVVATALLLLESASAFSIVMMGALPKPSAAADAMALKIGLHVVPKKAAPAAACEGNRRGKERNPHSRRAVWCPSFRGHQPWIIVSGAILVP
jgi:hypothetical protein